MPNPSVLPVPVGAIRNDIVPVHHKRITLLLDGRRGLKTHPIKGLNNLPADPHLFSKRMDCCCQCLVQDSILSLLIHSLVLLYLTAVDVASTSHHFRESYPLFQAFPRRLRGDFASGRESLVLHPPILRRFESAARLSAMASTNDSSAASGAAAYSLSETGDFYPAGAPAKSAYRFSSCKAERF